jgi:aminopeptidase
VQAERKSLVLGVYRGHQDGEFELTPTAEYFDSSVNGKLRNLVKTHAANMKSYDSRIFYGLSEYDAVAVVGLTHETTDGNTQENINEKSENVRKAVAVGVKALHQLTMNSIDIDPMSDPEAAAEGAGLATFAYNKLKTGDESKTEPPNIQLYNDQSYEGSQVSHLWHAGTVKAAAQNLAREWMETPSNLMTPSYFTQTVTQCLQSDITAETDLTITTRDEKWIRGKKMGAFLSVAKGSAEEPKLLEITYCGPRAKQAPLLVLVGKGVTFDSGGISIKPASNMDLMRGDMGGAAVVCATIKALLQLNIQANIRVLAPLCENMVSSTACKPGDVVTAMNGKTIQVDNTDAEGRLLLADALCYAQTFNPDVVINVATLTGAMNVALGSGATGTFATNDDLWKLLYQASYMTGDRLWRMPLFAQYRKQIESHLADINNVGKRARSAGACTAAAFLHEFVHVQKWAHLDIAGVMESHGEVHYLSRGLSGRPTRSLVEFVRLMYGET